MKKIYITNSGLDFYFAEVKDEDDVFVKVNEFLKSQNIENKIVRKWVDEDGDTIVDYGSHFSFIKIKELDEEVKPIGVLYKDDVIKAIKSIARLNKFMRDIESILGQNWEDGPLIHLSSELIANLANSINSVCDKTFQILIDVNMEDDMDEIYKSIMETE